MANGLEAEGFTPSSRIAAAWEVVEKLQPQFRLRLERPAGSAQGFYEVEFIPAHPVYEEAYMPVIDAHVEGRDVPHLICLAALKAVGALADQED